MVLKPATKKVSMLIGLFALLSSYQVYAIANASFEGDHFSGSGQCVQCHDGLVDAEANDISMVKSWATSMMANSTRDPYWLAKVASEVHRTPALSDELNDTCSRCHAPMANESAKKAGDPVILLDDPDSPGDGFLDPANAYHDHAIDGVSCTACHQISDDSSLGTLNGFSGNYVIDTITNKIDRPAFGQYSNVQAGAMRNQVEFTPLQGLHMQDSSLCATCHNLKTPFVDKNGDIASVSPESEFPEQMAYTEWENSAYRDGGPSERSCQSCHMPVVDSPVKISTFPGFVTPRSDFSEHSFLGANTTMMHMLNQNAAELGVTATDFDRSILANRAFLKGSAQLEIVSSEIVGTKVNVTLKITNHAGHKLPSAYPSRRVYIHFMVKDGAGRMLFESGKTNADGSITGANNDLDSSSYEPHYELISSPDQVQIYEPIMQNTDSEITHTLLRAASYRKDNRLPPAGFDKASVPNDVAVKGLASIDLDFNSGSDSIRYEVELGETQNIRIEAELKYQALSYGHLQDLFDDASAVAEVDRFKTYFMDDSNIRSETLATASMDMTMTKEDGRFIIIPLQEGKAVIFGL